MATNEVKKIYYNSVNWTAPAGVTAILVNPVYPITSITNGGYSNFNSTFLRTSGNIPFSFGNNINGQLGIGSTVYQSSPIAVLGGLSFTKIYNQTTSTYAMGTNGVLYSWGGNANGQLGQGTVTVQSSPVAVLGGLYFYDFQASSQQSLAAFYFMGLTNKGKLYSFGDNTYGQLGVSDTVPRSSPVAVTGNLNITNFNLGVDNVIAIDNNGKAYSWGRNQFGQLGTASLSGPSGPTAVSSAQIFAKFLVNGYSSIGLTRDGKAYTSGRNASGQLGVGDVVNRSSPVAVLGNLTFQDVYANYNSQCFLGLTYAGKAWSWGLNANGELGVGDVIPRSSPVAVLGGLTFKKLYTSNGAGNILNVFGLTYSGDLYAWGVNTFGQLGSGDIIPRSSPTLVLGGLKWSEIFLPVNGYPAIFGISRDGQLYSWGYNGNGELGLGDVVNRSSPVAVLGTMGPSFMQTSISGTMGQPFKFPVTPGTTYVLNIGQGVSFFDNNPIATGPLDRVEISYFV